MPATNSANPTRRKGPAFKPPRPVQSTTKATTSAAPKRAFAAPSRPAGVIKKPAPARQVATKAPRQSVATVLSSDDEDKDVNEEDDAPASSDPAEDMEDASDNDSADALATEPVKAAVPPRLLARLLHEGFEDDRVQIQRGALDLTGQYIDIFIREAIFRAREERSKSRTGMINDGFLQVEDLEKLAPGLVLDF